MVLKSKGGRGELARLSIAAPSGASRQFTSFCPFSLRIWSDASAVDTARPLTRPFLKAAGALHLNIGSIKSWGLLRQCHPPNAIQDAHNTLFEEGIKLRQEVACDEYTFPVHSKKLLQKLDGSEYGRALVLIIGVHVREALKNGLIEVEIREPLIQVGGYCGLLASECPILEALRVAERVNKESKKEVADKERKVKYHYENSCYTAAPDVMKALKVNQTDLFRQTQHCYRKITPTFVIS
ncbi:uncharacterized protein BDR25DRAFT_359241 [Lindgomyces ingoldianus]|uniref:Uncharacterized protein n=1 Tax=Lindgomyces ingoldianus TaxID=673940 RepID=A0ACB6QIA7_9PLEO|nr:uncharacterized protein BDR25DRAFT_359241 [Lindgomyces ingoldianus]KAF2466729.1 hypothetical protein BDR25DRAFT_359241 [Lindgomyces ingoldianus]